MTSEVHPMKFAAAPYEAKAIDLDKRQVTHLISTASLDRDGDVIEPGGWNLKPFQSNPVVLLDHQATVENIIGKGEVRITDSGLEATTTFGDVGKAAMAMWMVADGLARAWSVGFNPTKYHMIAAGVDAECKRCMEAAKANKGKFLGLHFVEQELREYSLVAIPANQDAVLSLSAKGFQRQQIAELVGMDVTIGALMRAKTSGISLNEAKTRRLVQTMRRFKLGMAMNRRLVSGDESNG